MIDIKAIKPRHGNDGSLPDFSGENRNVLDLFATEAASIHDAANIEVYSSSTSKEFYRNFLNWLFTTFNEDEIAFRRKLIERLRLRPGDKVLVTGCGFGDDIPLCVEAVGPSGQVHGQDISKEMVLNAAALSPNVLFTISNALHLPYQDRYFDAVFHFGGINLFGDLKRAINEMERITKVGGRIVFGDEGVASHLRETEYGKVAINNISIWASSAPMADLPENALDISLEYVLGNCFYVIGFTVGDGLPYMNIDVEHLGTRGGTARSRFFGTVEGVTSSARAKLYAAARAKNTSVHKLLSELIEREIPE